MFKQIMGTAAIIAAAGTANAADWNNYDNAALQDNAGQCIEDAVLTGAQYVYDTTPTVTSAMAIESTAGTIFVDTNTTAEALRALGAGDGSEFMVKNGADSLGNPSRWVSKHIRRLGSREIDLGVSMDCSVSQLEVVGTANFPATITHYGVSINAALGDISVDFYSVEDGALELVKRYDLGFMGQLNGHVDPYDMLVQITTPTTKPAVTLPLGGHGTSWYVPFYEAFIKDVGGDPALIGNRVTDSTAGSPDLMAWSWIKRSDLNGDGIVGGPDFTTFIQAFSGCTGLTVAECEIELL